MDETLDISPSIYHNAMTVYNEGRPPTRPCLRDRRDWHSCLLHNSGTRAFVLTWSMVLLEAPCAWSVVLCHVFFIRIIAINSNQCDSCGLTSYSRPPLWYAGVPSSLSWLDDHHWWSRDTLLKPLVYYLWDSTTPQMICMTKFWPRYISSKSTFSVAQIMVFPISQSWYPSGLLP